jgi:hypothetical protein
VSRLVAVLVAVAIAGCNLASSETPDPAAIPDGPLEAQAAEATGPIVELGSNVMEGRGWRYAIYPSDDGWCVQLETTSVTAGECGDLLPAEGDVFGAVRSDTDLGGGITSIDGIVSDAVTTVWLILEGGGRAPAQMLSLEDAELGGLAFVRLVPQDVVVTHLQAVALSGEILETVEVSATTTVP